MKSPDRGDLTGNFNGNRKSTSSSEFAGFSWKLNNSRKSECAGYNKTFIGHCFHPIWNVSVK